MTENQLRAIPVGSLLRDHLTGENVRFVGLHTAETTPGRYHKQALIQRAGREMSIRMSRLEQPQ